MKRTTILLGLLMATITASIPTSLAQAHSEDTVHISISSLVTGAENSEHKMYTKALADGSYDVKVIAKSENADRPGSSIIVRSGKQEVRFENMERKDFKEQSGNRALQVTGGSVSVFVKLGRDKLFSSDRDIQLHKVAGASATLAPAAKPTRPAELPHTGSEVMFVAVGVAVAGYAAHMLHRYFRWHRV